MEAKKREGMRSVSVACGEGDRTYVASTTTQKFVVDREREDALRSIDHLLLALASCTIGNARNHLRREGLSTDGLEVDVSARYNEAGGHYEGFTVALRLDDSLSAEERRAVLDVAHNCLIHKTLVRLSGIDVSLAPSDSERAA